MMSLPAEKGDFDAGFMLYDAHNLYLKIKNIKKLHFCKKLSKNAIL